MLTIHEEIDSFRQFVLERSDNGGPNESLEDLLILWRQEREAAQTVEDIRQGIEDHKAEKGQPLKDVFSEVRRDLGLGE